MIKLKQGIYIKYKKRWVDTNIDSKHNWEKMLENVNNHIRKLNFSYKN